MMSWADAQAMSQVPGETDSVRADTCRAFVEGRQDAGHHAAYTQALFAQIGTGPSPAMGIHEIQQRTANQFLETHDRVDSDEFLLTQESLADMLGVTRPSVTVAAGSLQSAGLITYRRGRVVAIDRARLEGASCECYATVRAEYERLMSASFLLAV